jgi:hypothetical protein
LKRNSRHITIRRPGIPPLLRRARSSRTPSGRLLVLALGVAQGRREEFPEGFEARFGDGALGGDRGGVRRREDDTSRRGKGEGFVLGEGGEGEEEAEEEEEERGGALCCRCRRGGRWRAL